jgi:soluble lytic murein transglycosylase-like protein
VVNERQRKIERRWKQRGEFRVICDCQRHRSERTVWHRAWRVASRGAAVLVGIPLAFAALDINSAMTLNVFGKEPVRDTRMTRANAASGTLPMFTTRSMRDQFLTRDASPRSLTLDMFKEAYFREHVPYGDIIFREARRNDLPPELVAAMVHTESDFRRDLVSEKSAQGLMQIVPDTARLLGIRDPFDPQQNIAAGTKYFRYLLDRFDNESTALAAYNAGEGNVERFGGIPPFAETRNYIVKVNRRTDRYRQRVHNTYLATLRVQRDSVQ